MCLGPKNPVYLEGGKRRVFGAHRSGRGFATPIEKFPFGDELVQGVLHEQDIISVLKPLVTDGMTYVVNPHREHAGWHIGCACHGISLLWWTSAIGAEGRVAILPRSVKLRRGDAWSE